MNLLFKHESCGLFLKIKTIVECEGYYETLKNYYDDPVDGISWSKVKTKKWKAITMTLLITFMSKAKIQKHVAMTMWMTSVKKKTEIRNN